MHPQDIMGYSPSLWVLAVTCLLCGLLQHSLLKEVVASQWRIIVLYTLLICAGLIGGKIVSLSTRDWQLYDPLIRELGSGWRYAGVLAAFIISLPILQRLILPKVHIGQLADMLALTTALGIGLFRAHCYMLGCCTGHLWEHGLSYARGSAVWWHHYRADLIAVSAPQSLPVIPLHLLFACASLATFIILLCLRKRGLPAGHLALWFLVIHESSKVALELLRSFQPVLFTISLVIAFCAGLSLLYLHSQKVEPPYASRRQ